MTELLAHENALKLDALPRTLREGVLAMHSEGARRFLLRRGRRARARMAAMSKARASAKARKRGPP